MFSQFKEPKTNKDKLTIIMAVFIFGILLVLTYSILGFFLYYWPLTLAVMTILLYQLFRMVGTILMFPGYFNYYKGSIEASYSKELHRKLSQAFKNLQQTHNYLVTGIFRNTDRESIRVTDGNFDYIRDLLQDIRQRDTLSPNKIQLLQKMNQIRDVYNQQEENKDSIKRYMYKRHNLQCLSKPSAEMSLKLQQLAQQASIILEKFLPVQGNMFQNFYKQSYNQKLYQIRFTLGMYDNQFHYEQHFLHDRTYLIIIKGFVDTEINPSKRLVLFCNPNGAFIETFPFQTSIIRFYIDLGYNVALWNYRGYSKSVGYPNLTNNKQDVLLVHDFLKQKSYDIQIAHGYSIGGPTSIYLASQRQIPLLITDRTFCSLQEVAKKFSKIAVFLLKLVFRSEIMDYSQLYLNLKCRKLMIYDPLDDNIDNISSLKTGVCRLAMSIINQQDSENQTQTSQQNSGLFLNAKAAIKTIFPNNLNQKHFPTYNFSRQLILNSLPFIVDKRKNPLMKVRNLKKQSQLNLQTTIQNIHTNLLKSQLDIKNQSNKNIKTPSKQLLQLIGNIHYVDSTSMGFPSAFLSKFKQIVSKSYPIQQMKSYIEGLIVFGSYPLYKQNIQNPSQVRIQTIFKLYDFCNQLKYIEEILKENNYQIEASIMESLRLQFYKIILTIYNNLQHPIMEKVGMILPVDCGHNGDLREYQYKLLKDIIFQRNSQVSTDAGSELMMEQSI